MQCSYCSQVSVTNQPGPLTYATCLASVLWSWCLLRHGFCVTEKEQVNPKGEVSHNSKF